MKKTTLGGPDAGLEDRTVPTPLSFDGVSPPALVNHLNSVAEPEAEAEDVESGVADLEAGEIGNPATLTEHFWNTDNVAGDPNPANNKPWLNSYRIQMKFVVGGVDGNGDWTGVQKEITLTTTVKRRNAGAALHPRHMDEVLVMELAKLGFAAEDTAGNGFRTTGVFYDGSFFGYTKTVEVSAISGRTTTGDLVAGPARYLPVLTAYQ